MNFPVYIWKKKSILLRIGIKKIFYLFIKVHDDIAIFCNYIPIIIQSFLKQKTWYFIDSVDYRRDKKVNGIAGE